MGNKLVTNIGSDLGMGRQFGFFEDFLEFVSGDLFTDTSGDTGASCAVGDAAGGIMTLTTGATDNNEAYCHTTKELFLLAAGKPLVFETRLQYAEANTDDANVCFGFMNAVGADSILDNGGGPKASYSGAVFFKTDGDTLWQVENSIGTSPVTTRLTAAASLDGTAKTAGGAAYRTYRIEINPHGGGASDISFWIDNVLVAKHKDQTYASATEMMAFVGVKAGDTNSEVVLVDYVSAYQLR